MTTGPKNNTWAAWLKFDQTDGGSKLVCDRCQGSAELPDSTRIVHLYTILVDFNEIHIQCPETWEEKS